MYVSTMLMLLVLMTYGRLDSYSGFGYVQSEFKNYIEKQEREFINNAAIECYNNTTATSKPGAEQTDHSKARAKLPFNFFVDKKQRAENPLIFDEYRQITKNLIHHLYADQKFFKEAEATHNNLIDDILNALISTTDAYDEKKKLKKIKEISTVELNNHTLNQVFNKMIKGSIQKPERVEDAESNPEGEEEEKGYYPLVQFLTLDYGNYTIRVFLASPELLAVLFDPGTVSDIIAVRKQLYNEVMKEAMTTEEATKQFQAQFQNRRLQYLSPERLDFGVSKIDPNTYASKNKKK